MQERPDLPSIDFGLAGLHLLWKSMPSVSRITLPPAKRVIVSHASEG